MLNGETSPYMYLAFALSHSDPRALLVGACTGFPIYCIEFSLYGKTFPQKSKNNARATACFKTKITDTSWTEIQLSLLKNETKPCAQAPLKVKPQYTMLNTLYTISSNSGLITAYRVEHDQEQLTLHAT